jgi:hypothetical protein
MLKAAEEIIVFILAMKNLSSLISARILKGNINITATTSAFKVAGLTTRMKALRAITRIKIILIVPS